MADAPTPRRRRLRDSWRVRVAAALALAGGAAVAVAAAAGFAAVGRAWAALHPGWLVLVVVGQLLALAGYVAAYRPLVAAADGPNLSLPAAARLVAVGFGLPAFGGGFSLDRQAVKRLGVRERGATVRVLGLGALEYAVLAPLAWACALVLLIGGQRPSVTLPWVVGVPAGAVVAAWALRHRPTGTGFGREGLRRALDGLAHLGPLAARPLYWWPVWLGMAVYWAGDLLAMWAALRCVGLTPSFPVLVVGLATGYAATRRSLPLAGAGATEALMPLAFSWLGLALAPALVAVLAYRSVNLLGALGAGLHLRDRSRPTAGPGRRAAAGASRRLRPG